MENIKRNIEASVRKKVEVKETVKEFKIDPEAVFWAFDKLFRKAFPVISVLTLGYMIYHVWLLLN